MAAPQIGVGLRVFVTEIRATPLRPEIETDEVRVFINPEIVWWSDGMETIYNGCGSVAEAGLFGPVERLLSVTVKAWDSSGVEFEFTATGLLSHVIQHEMDHLEGITFLEHVKDVRTLMSARTYKNMMKSKI